MDKKTRSVAGSFKFDFLYPPRDTALRSVSELEQFLRKNQAIFCANDTRMGMYKEYSATANQLAIRFSHVLKLHSGCALFSN